MCGRPPNPVLTIKAHYHDPGIRRLDWSGDFSYDLETRRS